MYGLCQICSKMKISFDESKTEGNIEFYEFTRKEEKYTKDGKDIKTIKNINEKKP